MFVSHISFKGFSIFIWITRRDHSQKVLLYNVNI